jgi:superfamily II DNA or RNA helicase
VADIVLTEKLLANLAGWEAVKTARTILAENRVLSSAWQPPVLRGVVQSGSSSYRAGLVIRRENDAENLCTCRESREWGTLCPHSIAVGLHFLKPAQAATPANPSSSSTASPASSASATASASAPSSSSLSRSTSSSSRSSAPRDARRILRSENSGEPLTLHVVLPPNLADAVARGKATVFFEGQWRRGRTPLASLPLDQTFLLGPEDARLLDAAETLAGGDTPAMLQVTTADLSPLLAAMVGHPRLSFGKIQTVTVAATPWKIPLRAVLEADGQITLSLRPLPRPPTLIPGSPPWILSGHEFRQLALPPDCYPVLGGPLRLPRTKVPAFVASSLPILERDTDLEAGFTAADFQLSPQPPKFHLQLAGGLASLTAHLQCTYGPRIMTVGVTSKDEALWLPDPKDPKRYSTRDLAAERKALDRLLRNGFSAPDAQGRCQLHGQNPILTFFAREYPRLEREWEVTLEERLERSTRQNLERIEPRFEITPSGEQWFDLQVSFSSGGGERLPTSEIQRLLRGGQNFTRLKNGRFALIDTGAVEELEEILVDCAPEQHAGGYRIGQAQAGFLDATLRTQGWSPVAPAAWRERALQQSGDVALDCPPLGPLENVLRPYQKQGVAWMAFLRRNGFGGILADEMGLGKTLQTLALLAANARAAATNPRPSLVICPTSLVSNWIAEATRFCPELRTLALDGPDRASRFADLGQVHLAVTSYALIRRDFDRYRGFEFDTVILDEAQHIKNRQTQNASAVKALRSRHRLVLTGTPLENSVLDLWSIFDFLMPGYLGAARDFKDRYETPIVKEKDAATQARLARRVRPFLLRRLKRDVAPELPARIDQVVWCDLNEAQAAVYQQLLSATRRDVLEAAGPGGASGNRMLVLTALLRLRQACCDLRLMGVEEKSAAPDESNAPSTAPAKAASAKPAPDVDPGAKVEAFTELLEEVLDGGHRVLVFSQFTRMLALLQEHLEAEKIPFCYLDGSTRNRAAEVARFQNSPDVPVFLISLKAGGVGLNLTAADTVVHFDPWWNPAVEDQATDRAHRIGQSRVVTSYKLIARGTVEEKILRLQERKREVTRGLLAGEEAFTESLTWSEIQELLA